MVQGGNRWRDGAVQMEPGPSCRLAASITRAWREHANANRTHLHARPSAGLSRSDAMAGLPLGAPCARLAPGAMPSCTRDVLPLSYARRAAASAPEGLQRPARLGLGSRGGCRAWQAAARSSCGRYLVCGQRCGRLSCLLSICGILCICLRSFDSIPGLGLAAEHRRLGGRRAGQGAPATIAMSAARAARGSGPAGQPERATARAPQPLRQAARDPRAAPRGRITAGRGSLKRRNKCRL